MHRPHWDETRMCYEYYNVRPLYHAFWYSCSFYPATSSSIMRVASGESVC